VTHLRDRLAAALSDRYRIEREVGAGGMATVYLAQDLKHDRQVALKVLRPELGAVLGGERFLREIQIAARIQHPHVLTLLDSGEADGLLYYVMPFVRGESLRDRLGREGKLPIADVIRMLRDVADGLAEAHRQGLVHRDVKPDNVLISGNHAVVTDFGVAKAASTASGPQALTTAGVALGTPAYMSPEQVTAETAIDHRTDIYALGVMGYELLAGRPPFLGATAQEVLVAHLASDPEPVTGPRPDTPPALAQLIMTCLAKQPADRWQTTDEVLRRLEAMTTPSGGVPSMRLAATRAGGRRFFVRRALVLAPVLVALVVVGVVRQRRAGAVRALAAALAPAADSGRLDAVYAGLQAAGVALDARGLRDLAGTVGAVIALETDPPGAVVTLTRVAAGAPGAEPLALGRTPLRALVVAGGYVARADLAGFEALTFTAPLGVGDTVVLRRTLVDARPPGAGMVLVAAGAVVGPVAADFAGQTVPAFLIDRTEVTNEAFLAFVADGGYGSPEYWPDSLVLEGRRVPLAAAVRAFVDRTGVQGPRTWTGGTFPEGAARHPVTGVSWYEAAAYARWVGKGLPSLAQWWRAALGDVDQPYPWGYDHATLDERSNFSMMATAPVDAHDGGASPYGAYAMAGNVREWLAGEPGAEAYPAVGGSWQDPTYMFYTPNIERFAPAYASTAIGFRLVAAPPGR